MKVSVGDGEMRSPDGESTQEVKVLVAQAEGVTVQCILLPEQADEVAAALRGEQPVVPGNGEGPGGLVIAGPGDMPAGAPRS